MLIHVNWFVIRAVIIGWYLAIYFEILFDIGW